MCVAVLNCAARHNDPLLATSAFRILSSRRSSLSSYHYEALLTAYAGSGDFKTAFRILSIMSKAGFDTDSSNTRPLFLHLSQSSDSCSLAWKATTELHEEGHVIPPAAANVILESLITLDLFQDAAELYKSLYITCEAGPNTDTFNILFQARTVPKDQAMFLAAEMKALNIKPDPLTYDRLILICLRQEDYEDAFRYLEEMTAAAVGTPEQKHDWWMRGGTVSIFVKRCALAGDSRAWTLLDKMKERGLRTEKLADWAEVNFKRKKANKSLGELEEW